MKNRSLIYTLIWILGVITLFSLLGSCTSDRPVKWRNTYVYFSPENQETIYIAEGQANFKKAFKTQNGELFKISFQHRDGSYRLSVASDHYTIHHLVFSGYDAIDQFEEQPWEKINNKLSLEAENLLPPNGGYYMIMISEDLER